MDKPVPANKDGEHAKCVVCGKIVWRTSYGLLCDAIMQQKPTCSYECRAKLKKG